MSHRKSVVALLLAFGALAVVPHQTDGQAARQGVRVSGTVVDAYVGVKPVPTRVTMWRKPGSVGFGAPPRNVDLGKDGSFVFDDVPPGTYGLSTLLGSEIEVEAGAVDVAGLKLRHVGLTEMFPSVRMDDSSDVPPTILSNIEFNIEMGSGQVLAGGLNADRPLLLPPGRRFFFPEPADDVDDVFVRSIVSGGVDLLREPLTIDPGAPERGIQIILTRERQALARVRGRVTGGAGQLSVQMTRTMSSPRKLAQARAPVAPDGSFEIDIEPGIYDVHVGAALRVLKGIAVPRAGRTIDIVLPQGRLFDGGSVPVIDPQGRPLSYSFGRVVLAARGTTGVSRFPVEVRGFWGALAPGEYALTLESLPTDVSVAALEAGGVNLLEQPYVVSAGRNPPSITLVLKVQRPVPPSVYGPPRSLQELLGVEGGGR